MPKIKHFLYFFAALLVSAFFFTACPHGNDDNPEEVTVKSLELNKDDAVTLFKVGDVFSAEGIKVVARMSDGSRKTLTADEYTLSGYSDYVDADGKLFLSSGNYKQVTIKVSYGEKSATYTIGISRVPQKIEVDTTEFVSDFFTGDTINWSGLVVKAFYSDEDTEGTAVDASVVSFTSVDMTKSGTAAVCANILDVESDSFDVNVYRIEGVLPEEFEKGDPVPSLAGIKVYLGDEEAADASVKLLKDDEEYIEETLAVGDYSVVVTAGAAEKEYLAFTVVRPDSEKFKVLEDGTKIEGAALQVRIDASDMGVKWAEHLENVKPEVTLSDGTLSETPGAFFTAPAADGEGNVTQFTIQIVLTAPVSTTSAEISANIAGTTYKTTVRFANGAYIPSSYVPTKLVLDKTALELACETETTFKVTDKTYGLDYSSDVVWSIVGGAAGSKVENGVFTAGTVSELTEVTVRATLKANAEVFAEAIVTINPDKADVSGIYGFDLSNTMNNGAFFNGEISWTEEQYKVVEISSKSEGVSGIINVNPADGKTTFMVNLASGEYRGVTKTFVFRVKTSKGAYYDVSVTYTDRNVTASGSDTTIDKVSVEDAVLNPKLMLAKENIEVEKDGKAEVAISYDEILDFDAAKLSAVSSSEDVVTAVVEGTSLKLSGVEGGTARVTVSYDGSDTVCAVLNVSVVAELSPFGVEIITNDGVWCKIKVAYNNEAVKINPDNSAMTNARLSMDGSSNANVSYVESAENAVVFARSFGAANMTAAVEQTLTFDIETAAGEKYSFTVKFTGGKNLTITPTSTEFVLLKELVLSADKLVFESMDAQTVSVSQVGIADYDASALTVKSSDEGVATAAVSDGKVTVTPVADGSATVTVSFGDYSKTLPVTVQTSLEEVELTFTNSSKIIGAGLEIYWSNSLSTAPSSDDVTISVVFNGGTDFAGYEAQLTKDDYVPIWIRADGLHFTVSAGFPDGGDYTHEVTISFVQNGKKYTGTCKFEGNAFVN